MPPPITATLDWLRYSIPWEDENDLRVSIDAALSGLPVKIDTGELLPPGRAYDTCMALTHGYIHYHSQKPEQRIGIEFKGHHLNNLLLDGVQHDQLVRHANKCASSCPRIDIALDVKDRGADPIDVYTEWANGAVKTRARTVTYYASERRVDGQVESAGDTLYIGSWASKQSLRVYNKALQTGKGGDWVRVELTQRDKRALALIRAMGRDGIVEVGKQAIRRYAQVDNLSWWVEATTGPVVYIEPTPRPITNTEKWLLELVLPTLQKFLIAEARNGNERVYRAFYSLLHNFRRP